MNFCLFLCKRMRFLSQFLFCLQIMVLRVVVESLLFYLSVLRISIPDPTTATKEERKIKFVVLPFFVATNITKLKVKFLEQVKIKFWEPKKSSTVYSKAKLSSQKFVFGIRDPEKSIPDLGSWIQESKRHRTPDLDKHYCDPYFLNWFVFRWVLVLI